MTRHFSPPLRFVCLFLFTFSLSQALVQTAVAQPGFTDAELSGLDELMQGYVERGELAGNVTLIMHGDEQVYLEARGLQDDNTPMQTDSIFRIASHTKAITSTAILMLQDEGLLSVNAPLSDYLSAWSEIRVAVPGDISYRLEVASRPVRLRDLLTHTSGIGYGTNTVARNFWAGAGINGWYLAEQERTLQELVTLMARLPQDAQPVTEWRYGYSTDILGAVVEVVSGLSLDEFFRTRIFEPLGMNDTHFYLPPAKADRLAAVYGIQADGTLARAPAAGENSQGAYVEGPRTLYSGGAGLLSTAEDYARFLGMIANGGTHDGTRLLSAESVALMTRDQLNGIPFRPGAGFGFGFSVITDASISGQPGSTGSYGWSGAYHSTYWVDPAHDLIVVYLSQLLPAGNIDDMEALRAAIYEALED